MFDWFWKTVLGGSVELDTPTARPIVVDPDMGVPVNIVPDAGTSSNNSGRASTDQNDDDAIIPGVREQEEEEEAPPQSKKRGSAEQDENPSNIITDIAPTEPETTNGLRSDAGAANASIATKSSTTFKKARLGEYELFDAPEATRDVLAKVGKAKERNEAQRVSHDFDEMFNKLVAFCKDKGHCRVPQNYEEDKQLASWVKNLRSHHKSLEKGTGVEKFSMLTAPQAKQLDELGFNWKPKAGRPVGATVAAGAKKPSGRQYVKAIAGAEVGSKPGAAL